MSEGTTKPNGGREMNVETTEDIKERIENAGYNVTVNALQAHFSKEKVQEGDGSTGSSDSAKPTKAGDHTLVTNKATIAFKPLIPFIADGAKAKLKDDKKKGKDSKESKPKPKAGTTRREAEGHEEK